MKKIYPDYYLWSYSLFQTDLYKEFEEQVLSALREEEGVFNSNQLMQRAMPELVSTLESGFDLMASSMQAMNTSHTTELKKMSKLWSDFFALGNEHFNQNESSSTITLASTPAPSVTSVNNEVTSTNTLVTYTLNRKIVTVTDVWREYGSGLGGNPSVDYLEKEFGTAWRKDRTESRFFSKRNELYKAIKDKADKERISCEEAARRIEERRKQLGISLDKLRSIIKEDANSDTSG